MKNTLRTSCRQAVLSRQFFFAAAGLAAVMLAASADAVLLALRTADALPGGFHGTLMLQAVRADQTAFFVPILCTLPFSGAYLQDTKTRFLRFFVHRTSRRAYLAGRALAVWLSGGLAAAAGVILAYAAAAGALMPMEGARFPGMEESALLRELLPCCLNFFLSGGLWALVGTALSVWTDSRYVAYASPFTVFYLLTILYERFLPMLYFAAPREWLNPSGVWRLGAHGARLIVLFLTAAVGLCFFITASRRLEQI